MSEQVTTEEEAPPPEFGDMGAGTDVGMYVLPFADASNIFENIDTVDDLLKTIDAVKANAAATLSSDMASEVTGVWDVIEDAVNEGELTPTNIGGLFWWLYYNMGITVLSVANTGGKTLQEQVLRYAEQHVYKPKKAAAKTTTPPAATTPQPTQTVPQVTHAQQVVHRAVLKVADLKVPVTGLTQAEANAISKAIAYASAKQSQVTASALQAMLPNLRPGQVTQALDQLNRAATILERQVRRIDLHAAGPANASLSKTVAAQGKTLSSLTGDATKIAGLEALVKGISSGDLQKRLNVATEDIASNTKAIDNLDDLTKGISSGDLQKRLNETTTEVSKLDSLVKGIDSGDLQKRLNETSTAADKAQDAADKAQDCCAEVNQNVVNPANQGGMNTSLWKQLGKVVGAAFAIGWLSEIITTVVTVLDAKAEAQAIVADVELISGWAESSVQAIEGDLGNLGA